MDENTSTTALAQQVENRIDDLFACYHQVLRETLFTNRGQVRPAMLKGIAIDQANALLDFFREPASSSIDRGVQLCQMGLGEQSILRLAQSTRQFFLKSLEDGQITLALDLVDSYYNTLIQGYIRGLEKNILEEQERTRRAFLRVVSESTDKPQNI